MIEEKNLEELTKLYCEEKKPSLRDLIISKSLPLVRSIIGKINKPNTLHTQFEDLENSAIVGLIQALDSFDCQKNVQFSTYAYYRIKGSIIDYLRSVDQLPRKHRVDYGKIQEAISILSQELGREPTDSELSERLQMNIDDYNDLMANVHQRHVLSLDNFDNDDDSFNPYQTLEDVSNQRPDEEIESREKTDQILSKINKLKNRDRLILMLYYYENMTMTEIGLLLDISEARISQIIGKLLIQLKADLSLN